ncbi:MAG: transposase [Patescibacteria group bacterium]
MPSRNSIKLYVENSFYHIYNRGIDKKNIFIDEKDYAVFLGLLKRYLVPPPKEEAVEENKKNKVGPRNPRYRTDLHEKIQLVSYCLMPNHFHLMIKQATKEAITDIMRALSNSYVIYFNKKYKRTGPLFTGKYKAVLIEGESYLLHLTRYIHVNPLDLGYTRSDLVKYPYSSYSRYLGRKKVDWLFPEEILSFFKTAQKQNPKDLLSYQSFVEDYLENSEEVLRELTID